MSIERKKVEIIAGRSYLVRGDLLFAFDMDFAKMDTNIENKPRLCLCIDVFDYSYTKMVRWLTVDGIRYNRYTTAIFNVEEYTPGEDNDITNAKDQTSWDNSNI